MDKDLLREAQKHLSEARVLIETVRDDMSEKFDEMSEAWKDSDAAEVVCEKMDALADCGNALGELDTDLEEVMK